MLTPEQTKQIKQQLFSKIESSDAPNKDEVKSQVNSMNSKQFEEFLKQNNLIKDSKSEEECIFCAIVSGQSPSYLIDKNTAALAVLEINPLSKGHVIVIPKTHTEDSPKQAFELAKKIAKKIASVLDPKKVDIINNSMFGHEIINILPVYKDETIHSKRKHSSKKELEEMQTQLKQNFESEEEIPKEEVKPKAKILTDKDTWLPKRIP